jgi:uncharacterized radical SAM superfamily Fe-S cluster-containing enzyme
LLKTELRKKSLDRLLPKNASIIRITESICPVCVEEKKFEEMKIPAIVFEEDDKVWIAKRCKKHGKLKDLYWGDSRMYKDASQFQDPGVQLLNPAVKKGVRDINCPLDCGLCYRHKSHTALANLVVTNRCDLKCWYCFFYAKEGSEIYEPTLDQIREMLRNLRNQKPVPCNAIQFTGGNPELREDLFEIIKIAKEEGLDHIQVNTQGTARLAHEPDFARRLKELEVNTIYLSFDGLTPRTNTKNYWEVPKILENCREVNLGIVLVPTVIGGVNDHELGDMIRFAAGNIDTIRGVDLQPVSIVGRVPRAERKKMRITIPDTIKKIEEQTDGQIERNDFYSIPCVKSLFDFVEVIKGKQKYRFSNHFACGSATYVYNDNGKLLPITKFIDVDGLFEYIDELTESIRESKIKKAKKIISIAKLLYKINSFIDQEKAPKNLNLGKAITNAIIKGKYDALRDFHHKSLFIGMMHFMDTYNYDVQRVERCNIHYTLPDGRLIPFCTFNVLPELYRDKNQRKFSIPAEEWEQKTGKKISEGFYKRTVTKEDEERLKEFYAQYQKPAQF